MWVATVMYNSCYGKILLISGKYLFMGLREITMKNILVSDNSWKICQYCFNNTFSNDTGTLEKNIPILDEVDDKETVSTF